MLACTTHCIGAAIMTLQRSKVETTPTAVTPHSFESTLEKHEHNDKKEVAKIKQMVHNQLVQIIVCDRLMKEIISQAHLIARAALRNLRVINEYVTRSPSDRSHDIITLMS